jgi:excinuclease ABC subunit C
VNTLLAEKLQQLPLDPGVYFHKSQSGEVIYVGKAANLRNRVRQYFQESRVRDAKTDALVAEIVDTDWITVETELDALFLESEMIKRYKPRYNILLRDDKSQLYIRIPMRESYPAVTYTRAPLDDDATYFGPYYNGAAVRKAMMYLRRIFPYSTHETLPKRVCLQYHIGLCPGVEMQMITSIAYKETLKRLMRYLRGERQAIVRELESEMASLAKKQQYEEAGIVRNRIRNLKELQRQIVFGDKEFVDISKDVALTQLRELLRLPDVPRRIEGYDISHMSGTNNVASMVVATNGLADKAQYRKFKMQLPGNNDFGHMRETMLRRFSGRHDDWPEPSLLLIDGGKGQLGSALEALGELGRSIPAIGLAKRQEEIVIKRDGPTGYDPEVAKRLGAFVQESEGFLLISLSHQSHIVKLLQRIRDESHRFAVSYHSTLKRKGATRSLLDDIPGIGPATRKRLVQTFGSGRGAKDATKDQLRSAIGDAKGAAVYSWFHGKNAKPEPTVEGQPKAE